MVWGCPEGDTLLLGYQHFHVEWIENGFSTVTLQLTVVQTAFKTLLTRSLWAHKLHHHQNKGKDPEQRESLVKLLGHKAVGNGCCFAQGYCLEPNFDVQAPPFTSTSCLQCPMYPLLLCSLNYNNTGTSSWLLPHENPAAAEWSQYMVLPWVLQWVLGNYWAEFVCSRNRILQLCLLSAAQGKVIFYLWLIDLWKYIISAHNPNTYFCSTVKVKHFMTVRNMARQISAFWDSGKLPRSFSLCVFTGCDQSLALFLQLSAFGFEKRWEKCLQSYSVWSRVIRIKYGVTAGQCLPCTSCPESHN